MVLTLFFQSTVLDNAYSGFHEQFLDVFDITCCHKFKIIEQLLNCMDTLAHSGLNEHFPGLWIRIRGWNPLSVCLSVYTYLSLCLSVYVCLFN
jgi:hypothetical protein